MSDRNYFPEDFQPTKFHVICGRGKKSYGHIGNQWFLTVVSNRINDYARADTKQEKSEIVQKLVGEIRDAGGFIRQDEKTGRYYRVAEGEGRDKVSQALRDALKHKYKSSKDVKRTNRKAKRLATRQHSSGGRRGSIGSQSERSVNSGYYSGAEVEVVGSAPPPLLVGGMPSPVLKPVTPTPSVVSAPDMPHLGQVQQPRSRSMGFPSEAPIAAAAGVAAVHSGAVPLQPAVQPRSQSIGGGPAATKAAWNANLFVASAPTPQSSAAGITKLQQQQPHQAVEAFPVQAFPEIDISALGYNQNEPQAIAARQASSNNAIDFQGSEFQHHRRPSLGGSSYASTSNNSGYHSGSGSARDYWSGESGGEWDEDNGEVDLDFCLELDDMEQQAAAMGMDFTDMVYASPPRHNPSPGQQQRQPPSPAIQASPVHIVTQQQPSPVIAAQLQQQQRVVQQQPSPQTNIPRVGNPSPLNLPQQHHNNNSNTGQTDMRLQIQQMLATTQLPQHIQQQQQQTLLQQPQYPQQLDAANGTRLTAANLTTINYAAAIAPQQQQQQQAQAQQQIQPQQTVAQLKGIPQHIDSNGRVSYDV